MISIDRSDPLTWPALATAEEAAECLGVKPQTVRDMCAAGELPASKVGKSWVIDLKRYIADWRKQASRETKQRRTK
jgi:excisionase family DNA binding protein